MNDQFSPFRVFDEPLIRIGVTTENKATSIPIEAITDRAVKNVNGRKRRIR
jgi:hypothetical protein